MKITTEIRGLDETLANIRRLGDALSTEVEINALKKVAKPYAEGIAARIDADHHESGLTAADIRVAVSREAEAEGAAAVLVGATGRHGAGHGRAFILSWLEFGTFRTPGYHIVANEFRQHAPDYVTNMGRELAAAFSRAKAKFLRRAA